MPAARRKPEISLFHPKKKPQKPQSPPKASTPRPSQPKPEVEDDDVKLPDGPYQEYKIMSSASTGWKYNVMKFNSRDPVDVMTWQEPVKLNRKEPRRQEASGSGVQEAVAPMLGPDGKPVIGADGRMVMVGADGRPIHNTDGASSSHGKDAKDKGGRKKFQKKTKQVFVVPDHIRQLRREEKYPWVIENGTGSEVWLGQMEEASKSETHGFFMPTSENKFQFVSAHRWYKFQKKQNHAQLSAEEVEKLMEQQKKNRDPEFWLMRRRNGQAPSAATSAIFKAEAEGRVLTGGSSSLVHGGSGPSLGPGGRKLKAVDKDTDDLFGDDEDGGPRRRKKEDDGEGDMDEMLYEEEFADDDEMEAVDEDDEDAKELEERLKKEYKNANKQREGYVDESEDEDEDELTKDGKSMKKLIRKMEKNAAYDSDDEGNPYASSDEDEEEEEPPVTQESAVQSQPSQAPSRSGSQTPAKNRSKDPSTAAGSRATSPVASGHGGLAELAKRATSPKPPKTKVNGANRATSPLGNGQAGSRATSPTTSRAGSPVAGSSTPSMNKKRKATDGDEQSPGSSSSSTKKRKSLAPGAIASGEDPLGPQAVIDWISKNPKSTTSDCIAYFRHYIKNPAEREVFTTMMKSMVIINKETKFLKLRSNVKV